MKLQLFYNHSDGEVWENKADSDIRFCSPVMKGAFNLDPTKVYLLETRKTPARGFTQVNLFQCSPSYWKWEIVGYNYTGSDPMCFLGNSIDRLLDEIFKGQPQGTLWVKFTVCKPLTKKQVANLHSGDQVFWSDPDDGFCSKSLTIASIEFNGNVVRIISQDGDSLECFANELY